ncbi:PREDICTED: RCC1 and BTB domain-containing protein 1-like [Trachymyrmex cornetzi]|uniref:RCC1 and BTB domain-containing protein 1-like n=1 Tax=Trachymyrmex cornetzi TaxID=471704 RepID=UPI00084F802C|nr:PREDICTED: RCC1 and BTB domain-containing protein 1-like [Trachymyrmex cornetzi]XP_018362147.1 PREDICTED: RCC1 and BTB domain-containing protein 1-like [Trachymyrmex cornetzi]
MCSNLRNWPVFSSLEPKFISEIHMVMVFGKLGKRALIVTKEKEVYDLNDNLQALENRDNSFTTLYRKKIKDLCGKDIKTFAYSMGSHMLALTNEGEVYSCDNVYGQWKNGTFNMDLTFTLINIPVIQDSQNMKRVVDIACGNKHFSILTEIGEVYAWKSNNSGLEGNSTYGLSITPKLILSNVGCISCGYNFAMTVTRNGKVYGWGSNDVGQLGIGGKYESKNRRQQTKYIVHREDFFDRQMVTFDEEASNFENKNMTPQLVGIPEGLVDKVTCGLNHTLVLTDKGAIYAWGGNKFSQLGTGQMDQFCSIPVMVSQMEKMRWVDIAALNNTSVAVTEAGRVYVWGDCRGECISTPIATSSSNVHDAFGQCGPSIMHKPLILNEKLDILGCLGIAFDDYLTSDLKIQVEGKCIYVHKIILTICSLHLRTMFEGDWAENNQSVIEINKVSHDVYKAYLKYLYTNTVDLCLINTFEKISELFDLANGYCEDNLKKQCIHRIKLGITVSNVAYFYSFAVKYNTEELREFCVRFASIHMMAVVETENFAKLEDENLMNRFINEAGKAGCFKN